MDNGGNLFLKHWIILDLNLFIRYYKRIDKINYNYNGLKLIKQYILNKDKDLV